MLRHVCLSVAAIVLATGIAYAKDAPLLAQALEGPMAGVEEVVFAKRIPGPDGHWYANFSYYAEGPQRVTYTKGAKLQKLNLRTGKLTDLLNDPNGTIRDPQVHYDGGKILFSYRPGGDTNFHLYEIDVDGSGLRQITDGPYDDIEPTYLPDGDILFVSSRCKRWVNCWLTQVAVMHRCDPDGENIRAVSSNNEHDNTPWPLADGRILYQRWEYVDRSQVHYHHLWAMNPDGTGQMVYYGNQTPGILMIDAKPIPGTEKVISIFSPGHGAKEHNGIMTVVDPKLGPDSPEGLKQLHDSRAFRDPYPFSEDCFLVAEGRKIVLMNGNGDIETVHHVSKDEAELGMECHEPRPIQPRPREAARPVKHQPDAETGHLILADVYQGRNMDGVEPGEIKNLLVLESLPKPINFTGGMEPLSYGGTFTLERVLGTVPVEPDGSAYMEVPPMRSLILVALDENDRAVKRMQSFLTVQPGEALSCVGCHEQRTETTLPPKHLQAMGRAPSVIEPIADTPDVFDFPRDIQPILDRHCVPCHDYEATDAGGPMAGGVILAGDRGPLYSHSYFELSSLRQFADGRNEPRSNYAPREFGSGGSELLKKLEGTHYGVNASEHEKKVARLWIDVGAPYPGTYAALGSGMIGGYAENIIDRRDLEWESTKAARDVMARRCASCHTDNGALPESISDNRDMPPWAIQYGDTRLRLSRHIIYNLTRPDKSLQLLAPLAAGPGGLGICTNENGEPANVFASGDDEDYRKLMAAITDAKTQLDTIKRFDMPGFQPRVEYVREMKRYGVLPMDLAEGAPVDPYATDRAYWKSLWWKPQPAVSPLARR